MSARAKDTARIPNILYSTTRSWNSGDDFILFGVRNIIDAVLPQHNPLIYNRNPDLHRIRIHHPTVNVEAPNIRGRVAVNLAKGLDPVIWKCDNSWRPPHDLSLIDFCVFAGTPEWLGSMTEPLVAALLPTDIPVAYIGIGTHDGIEKLEFDNFPLIDAKLLRKADLVIVRDSGCAAMLAPVSPVQLPCPALFAAPHQRQRTGKVRIALSGQGMAKGNGQRVDGSVFRFSVELFRRLSDRYDCTVVCHYIEDYFELYPVLGSRLPFLFSYDPIDYLEIYDGFDLTVTTRVHGVGLCASLGIPGIALAHSTRVETAAGFLADIVDVSRTTIDDVLARVDAFDVAQRSARLIDHKRATREDYLRHLRRFFEVKIP